MPLYFWDDEDGTRYREAYFSTYPGVWRHGDWMTVTRHGGVVVHGRSDATMNQYGVRMGSAEIYEVVEPAPQVEDCLVVGVEEADGGYWMPLFVVLADGQEPAPEVSAVLKDAIRTQVSPRHVPDEVIVVDVLPHTMTGKRLEVPVKRLLQGVRLEDAVNPTAVDAPEALPQFVALAQQRSGPGPAQRPGPGRSDAFRRHRAPDIPAGGARQFGAGSPPVEKKGAANHCRSQVLGRVLTSNRCKSQQV